MSENVQITLATVTVCDVTLPRWMTPFAQRLFAIPTHMTVQERLTLFQAALALPQGFSVVEIGSYLGASTAFLGFAALRNDGYVHAIDPWTNDAMGAEGERDTWGEFRKNTEPFEHYIVPHRGTSIDVFRREGRLPCNMLFIDGDHSYEAVCTDLRTWLPSLQAGGTLAMHDIDAPPVRQAFDDVVGAGGLDGEARVVDRLLICRPRAVAVTSGRG
jgi:predicted O-methyltransferase YrrM